LCGFLIGKNKMNKLYITGAIAAAVCGAYYVGAGQGRQQCRADNAIAQVQNNNALQQEILKIKGDVYAETVTSATDVIRGRLRVRYAIGD
jgi:hypothetical protein